MQILMYGWEYPPRISGGLGVACHAIVEGLRKKKVSTELVLPYGLIHRNFRRFNSAKLVSVQ